MARHFANQDDAPRSTVPAPRPQVQRQQAQRVDAGISTRRVSDRTAARHGGEGRVYDRERLPLAARIAAVVAAILVVAIIGVVAFVVVPHFFGGDEGGTDAGRTVTVTIPAGSGANDVAQILLDEGIIEKARPFYDELERQHADQSIKPGTYTFTTGQDVASIVRQLVAGPNTSENQLTVPEGRTVRQVAALVEETLGIPADQFLEQAKASNYVDDYPFLAEAQYDSLEGFLWPKTYDFSGQDLTADVVIRAMLDQYVAETEGLDFEAASAQIKERYGFELTEYDFITLASIIEREAFVDEDRPLVSSVFCNRMAIDMMLQSDATMTYVTGGEVSAADLQTESEYNTYMHYGLTPTPICSPSMESIQAAMNPADTDYLYFLLIQDGDNSVRAFSVTYEEHQAAIGEAAGDKA